MASQAEVDQLTQEVKQVKDNLGTAKSNIEERFSVLEQAISEGKTGNEVDLGPLKAAVEELGTPTQELEDLDAVKAAPAPPSTAAPTAADGTAIPHTTDPVAAQEQAAAQQQTPEQEAAARSSV